MAIHGLKEMAQYREGVDPETKAFLSSPKNLYAVIEKLKGREAGMLRIVDQVKLVQAVQTALPHTCLDDDIDHAFDEVVDDLENVIQSLDNILEYIRDKAAEQAMVHSLNVEAHGAGFNARRPVQKAPRRAVNGSF